MTPEAWARVFGGVAGAFAGAIAGAVLETIGWANDATAAVVLAVIGAVLGAQAGAVRHRRDRRDRARRIVREAPYPAAESAEDLEAVLAGFRVPRDESTGHIQATRQVVERSTALLPVFDLLARERRLMLEPGVSAPIDDTLAGAVASRLTAFCERAALDGIDPGESFGHRVAASTRQATSAGTALVPTEADPGQEAGEASSGAGMAGSRLDAAAARQLLLLMAEVEALYRTADRMTRDADALAALAALRSRAKNALAPVFGDPAPPVIERYFPSLAAGPAPEVR